MLKKQVIIYTILLVLLINLTLISQDQSINIEAKANIKEENGLYIIYIEIDSNLPEDSALEIKVFYIKKYFVPKTVRKPDEPKFNTELIALAEKTDTINNGNSIIELAGYKRKPFAGKYLVKISFDPDMQSDQIKQNLTANTEQINKEITFNYGTPQEFIQQKKDSRKEIYQTTAKLKEFYQVLIKKTSEFTQHGKFDAKKWEDWSRDWKENIKSINNENKLRLEGWIYRLETVGKHSIEAICVELLKLHKEFEEQVSSTSSQEALAHFDILSNNFNNFFEYNLKILGFGTIPNKPVVKEIISNLEKHLGLISKLHAKKDKKSWLQNFPRHQDNIHKELFKLINETSGYIFAKYTAPFTQDLLKYINECSEQLETNGDTEKIDLLFNGLRNILRDIKETMELE